MLCGAVPSAYKWKAAASMRRPRLDDGIPFANLTVMSASELSDSGQAALYTDFA
jgi:hypothetical protein